MRTNNRNFDRHRKAPKYQVALYCTDVVSYSVNTNSAELDYVVIVNNVADFDSGFARIAMFNKLFQLICTELMTTIALSFKIGTHESVAGISVAKRARGIYPQPCSGWVMGFVNPMSFLLGVSLCSLTHNLL